MSSPASAVSPPSIPSWSAAISRSSDVTPAVMLLVLGIGGALGLLFEYAAVANAAPLFLALAAFVFIVAIVSRTGALVAALALTLLQSPFPGFTLGGASSGDNWYTLRVAGFALVHWVWAVMLALLAPSVVRRIRALEAADYRRLRWLVAPLVVAVVWGYFRGNTLDSMRADLTAIGYVWVGIALAIVMLDSALPDYVWWVLPIVLAGASVAKVAALLAGIPDISSYDPLDFLLTPVMVAMLLVARDAFERPGTARLATGISVVYLLTRLLNAGSATLALGAVTVLVWMAFRATSFRVWLRAAVTGAIFLAIAFTAVGDAAAHYPNSIIGLKVRQLESLGNGWSDVDEMEHSTAVRAIELANIWDGNSSGTTTLVLGQGIGGSFTESLYPFPPLDESDYSLDERGSGVFMHPHNSPAIVSLKGGLLGLFFWAAALFLVLRAAIVSRASAMLIMALGAFGLISLSLGFSVGNNLLAGLLLGLLVLKGTGLGATHHQDSAVRRASTA